MSLEQSALLHDIIALLLKGYSLGVQFFLLKRVDIVRYVLLTRCIVSRKTMRELRKVRSLR